MFNATDPSVHSGPILVFMSDRSRRSCWTETRTLVEFNGPEEILTRRRCKRPRVGWTATTFHAGRSRLACHPQSSMLRFALVAGRLTFAVAGLFRPLSGRPDRARGEAPVSVPTPSFVSAPYFATRYS